MFNPYLELKGALRAIIEGRTLTFNEEYSLESVWHEIRHANANGWKNIKLKNDDLTMVMETVNQFCARRTYEHFVTALGGKIANKEAILASGYGYQKWVNNFGSLLKKLNISPIEAHEYLKDIILTTPYEEMYGVVQDYLIKHGVSKSDAYNSLYNLRLPKNEFDDTIKGVK